MSVSNSSTASKSRQPQPEAVEFVSLMYHMDETRELPNQIGKIGKYKTDYNQLATGLQEEGIEGYERAKTLILNRDKQLASLYAIHQGDQAQAAEQEQEELHPDFRIGKRGTKVFRTYSEDDIEAFPDIKWLVSGHLQASTVSLVIGPSNTGKTFLALDIAERVARGIHWLGCKVEQGNVLYIYAESKLGLKPRILAWKKHHNASSTPNLKFITMPVQLVNDRETLLETIAEMEEPPVLIVVDTFSNCAIGVNQNDQAEVFKVLNAAHEIVRDYGSHVMIVHHTNKSEDMNGSQAFRNHVDARIKLSRADKESPIIIHNDKQRDANLFNDIAVSLQVVDLYINPETLEPVTSCVVVASDANTPLDMQAEIETQEQETMLEVLTLHGELSTEQWKIKSKARDVQNRAFYRHVQKLAAAKKVNQRTKGVKGTAIYWSLPQAESKEQQQPLTPQTTTNSEVVLGSQNHLHHIHTL